MSLQKRFVKIPKSTGNAVWGYCRVSTDEQAKEGVSLQSQEMRIGAFCVASARPEPNIIIDDGQSAKSLHRPGMQAVLSAVKSGDIGTLVVLKLDRITLSVGDLSTLLSLFDKHGCALVAVEESLDTSTASGRLILNLLAYVSQWQCEAISERTASAFEYKRQSREVYCKDSPFGFRRSGGRLIEIPEEIDAIHKMAHLATSGGLSAKSPLISRGTGSSQRGGGRWYAQSVKAILKSRMTTELLAQGSPLSAMPRVQRQ